MIHYPTCLQKGIISSQLEELKYLLHTNTSLLPYSTLNPSTLYQVANGTQHPQGGQLRGSLCPLLKCNQFWSGTWQLLTSNFMRPWARELRRRILYPTGTARRSQRGRMSSLELEFAHNTSLVQCQLGKRVTPPRDAVKQSEWGGGLVMTNILFFMARCVKRIPTLFPVIGWGSQYGKG